VSALTLASVTRNLAINVRNLSEQEIWLEAFSGDFAAQARAQGLLESASGILSFVLNPILGGVSDSFGRKPLMNFAPVVSTFSCSLMAMRPGVPALVFRRFCSPLSNTPW
jgi:predicted MFS family arabinose efflux permease